MPAPPHDSKANNKGVKKVRRTVDHLVGATVYITQGEFMRQSGILKERGERGWCTISGIPKRIRAHSFSVVNDGKIDLKAARAMTLFMPPVMTLAQVAKASANMELDSEDEIEEDEIEENEIEEDKDDEEDNEEDEEEDVGGDEELDITFSSTGPSGIWEIRFEELRRHFEKCGNCDMGHVNMYNKTLKNWIHNQRRDRRIKSGTLNNTRISLLDSIGFDWKGSVDIPSPPSVQRRHPPPFVAPGKFQFNEQEFLDQHNDLCEVCGEDGELLCCATCSLVFHLQCIRPKRLKDPSDNWSCAYCILDGVRGGTRSGTTRTMAALACREMERMRSEMMDEKSSTVESEGGGDEKEDETKITKRKRPWAEPTPTTTAKKRELSTIAPRISPTNVIDILNGTCKKRDIGRFDEPQWEKRFEELKYAMTHGNYEVPSNDSVLRKWIRNQRNRLKSEILAKQVNGIFAKRINLLNSIGFDWKFDVEQEATDQGKEEKEEEEDQEVFKPDHQVESNNEIDKSQNVLDKLMHRRNLLTWVRQSRVAVEKCIRGERALALRRDQELDAAYTTLPDEDDASSQDLDDVDINVGKEARILFKDASSQGVDDVDIDVGKEVRVEYMGAHYPATIKNCQAKAGRSGYLVHLHYMKAKTVRWIPLENIILPQDDIITSIDGDVESEDEVDSSSLFDENNTKHISVSFKGEQLSINVKPTSKTLLDLRKNLKLLPKDEYYFYLLDGIISKKQEKRYLLEDILKHNIPVALISRSNLEENGDNEFKQDRADHQSDCNWDDNFGRLETFKEKYGHIDVAKVFKDKNHPLRNFIKRLRRENKSLNDQRLMELERIGFIFQTRLSWKQHFEELREHFEEHGNFEVPSEDTAFCKWVRQQRLYYKKTIMNGEKNCMSKSRIGLLDSIGFDWGLETHDENDIEVIIADDFQDDNTVSGRAAAHPEEWIKCLDPTTNNVYYFNSNTKVSRWDYPPTTSSKKQDTLDNAPVSAGVTNGLADDQWTDETIEESIPAANNFEVPDQPAADDSMNEEIFDKGYLLPEGWIEFVDPATKNAYYYNPITRSSTWDRPTTRLNAVVSNLVSMDVNEVTVNDCVVEEIQSGSVATDVGTNVDVLVENGFDFCNPSDSAATEPERLIDLTANATTVDTLPIIGQDRKKCQACDLPRHSAARDTTPEENVDSNVRSIKSVVPSIEFVWAQQSTSSSAVKHQVRPSDEDGCVWIKWTSTGEEQCIPKTNLMEIPSKRPRKHTMKMHNTKNYMVEGELAVTANEVSIQQPTFVTVILTKPCKTFQMGVTIQQAGTTGEILIKSINPGSLFVGTDLRVGMELVSIDGEKCVTIEQTVALLKTKEGQLTIVANGTSSQVVAWRCDFCGVEFDNYDMTAAHELSCSKNCARVETGVEPLSSFSAAVTIMK